MKSLIRLLAFIFMLPFIMLLLLMAMTMMNTWLLSTL